MHVFAHQDEHASGLHESSAAANEAHDDHDAACDNAQHGSGKRALLVKQTNVASMVKLKP